MHTQPVFREEASGGGVTKADFYWDRVVVKAGSFKFTFDYDSPDVKLDNVKQTLDGAVAMLSFAFILCVVVVVATAVYGIEPLRNMSPLEIGLVRMIVLGGAAAMLFFLLLSLCVVGFGLPAGRKKDCEETRTSATQTCDEAQHNKFHFSYEENNTKYTGRGGDGYIVGCIALPFIIVILVFPFIYNPGEAGTATGKV